MHTDTHTLHKQTHTHTHSSALSSKSNTQFEQGGQVLPGLTGPKCFKEAAERCSIVEWDFFSARWNKSLFVVVGSRSHPVKACSSVEARGLRPPPGAAASPSVRLLTQCD